MSENQLEVIVRNSGLESTKAQVMLDNFKDYFKIAADWENKVKTIIVTDASQKAEMKMAREARLFLREKRIDIENTRKQLKEQALREGKAIDGIANILKALIVPLEEYLTKQEKFIEIKKAEEERQKAEEERIAAERKAEEEFKVAEQAKREEEERIKAENEKMRKELEARKLLREAEDAKHKAELKVVEDKAREEREKNEAERREVEERSRVEREKAEAIIMAERREREKVEVRLKTEVECPFCHKKFIP